MCEDQTTDRFKKVGAVCSTLGIILTFNEILNRVQTIMVIHAMVQMILDVNCRVAPLECPPKVSSNVCSLSDKTYYKKYLKRQTYTSLHHYFKMNNSLTYLTLCSGDRIEKREILKIGPHKSDSGFTRWGAHFQRRTGKSTNRI